MIDEFKKSWFDSPQKNFKKFQVKNIIARLIDQKIS